MAPVTVSLLLLLLFYGGTTQGNVTPATKPTPSKPGYCRVMDELILCPDPPLSKDLCKNDSDCPGAQKCCYRTCIMQCLPPIFRE
uniref:Ceratoxin n=1 Tax=Ceratophrys calcarata TaxID=1260751 RepID=L7Q6B4_9NEOB|nr:ceratoxin precursor [Ceratophrys calcarata]